MEERFKIIPKVGDREADGSVRFTSHSAGDPYPGVFEIIHNMLAYGKSYGKIRIEPTGDERTCDFVFYNDADSEKLPTYERLLEIASHAGKSISSREGVSLCGVGTEVMALSSRLDAKSTIQTMIEVVKDGEKYGAILTFDGTTQKIKYQMIEPSTYLGENSYKVSFRGCKKLTDSEIRKLKAQISDTMYGKNFKIIFYTDKKTETIEPNDFLYREQLRGTDNYAKYEFALGEEYHNEKIILEMSDVSTIIKNKQGNKHELTSKMDPAFAGLAIRYKGIATVCRGDNSWPAISRTKHPTQNNIRIDITVGDYVFEEIHSECQVKIETTRKFENLTDLDKSPLRIYDVDNNKHSITKIIELIANFIKIHKSDNNSTTNIDNEFQKLIENLNNGIISGEDIKAAIRVLDSVSSRINVSTYKEKVLKQSL